MIRLSPVLLSISIAVCAYGCTKAQTPTKVAGAPQPTAAATAPATAAQSAPNPNTPRERSEWRQHFQAEQVTGAIAIFDSSDASLTCSNVAMCNRATIPASTFKIANSMIALETGVVQDAETVLPWDGKTYAVEGWNQNNTLRSAVRVSCAPCFQAIARKVGPERMQEWLTKLDYGNKDIAGGVDQFWLSGALRITPLQQIDFLRRFDSGKLPISTRTAETVRDIITLDVGQGYVLRGKTGLAQPPEFPELAAWFVGWLELGERRVFFATIIDGHSKDIDVKPARRRVTERVLRSLQLLPDDATKAI